MATFTKRSLLQTILLTVCTLGLYLIYWTVTTKRELNKAGGHVPNAILIIIPLANLYFWYRYAKSYATIVKKNNQRLETMAYFLMTLIPTLAGFRVLSGDLSQAYDLFVFFVLEILVLIIMYYFQDGYNEYQN